MTARPNPLGFSGLHLVLALSLAIIVVMLFGGCKRAKEQKADLGPAYSEDAIDDALTKAVSGGSLDGLRVAEFVNYIILRRIENSEDVTTIGGTSVSVIDLDNAKNKYTMRINKSYRNADGSFLDVTSEDNLTIAPAGTASVQLTQTAAASRSAALNAKSLIAWAKKSVSAKDTSSARPPAFYRLHESDDVIDPPDKVKARADCGGLNPCRIPVHYVQFDLVNWNSDNSYQKISFTFGFSANTPWVPFGSGFDRWSGLLVMDCRSTYVQLETRNVYVRDCQQLDDFQR